MGGLPSHHKLATPSPQMQGELYKEEEISEKNIDKSIEKIKTLINF